MGRIFVVRHGESTWNSQGRWAGHADPPLSETGRDQARASCASLRKHAFNWISSSRLDRARETASILAEGLGLELLDPVDDLNERHYGDVSGFTSAEIGERWPDFMQAWRTGAPVEIPGGEPWDLFVARVVNGLEFLSTLQGSVLFVAHLGVLRAIEYQQAGDQSWYENLGGIWVGTE